jgi:CRISPR-associated endoribonuclease Cas2, subtype I-E/ECOLI
MVVFSLESAPESLRGELTRWCLEIRAGVFVGTLTAVVRDSLWGKVKKNSGISGALMVYSYNNEQGYRMESFGDLRRSTIDFDGLTLMQYIEK